MTDEQINAAIAEAIDADPHWKVLSRYGPPTRRGVSADTRQMGGGAEVSILNMTDAERYHHELPQYRKRVVEMQDKINDLNYLVHKVFYVLEDLWNNPELVMNPEFRVSYKHIKKDIEDVDISKAQLTLKNAIESVEELQNLTKAQAQDIHDLQMQTSAQAAIIERLKKEVQK